MVLIQIVKRKGISGKPEKLLHTHWLKSFQCQPVPYEAMPLTRPEEMERRDVGKKMTNQTRFNQTLVAKE